MGLVGGGDTGAAGRSADDLSGFGLGDLRVGLDFDLLGLILGDRGPFGLTIGATVYAPTGDPGGFHGEGALRYEPHLGVDLLFDRWRLAADVAWQVRDETRIYNIVADDLLRWRGGFSIPLFVEGLDLLGSVQGIHHVLAEQPDPADLTRTLDGSPYDAIDGVLAVRYRAESGVDVTVGGGRGLNDGLGTPSWRAILEVGFGSPPDRGVGGPPDRDDDGILDDVDVCPFEAETFNGRRDDDGCPEEAEPPVRSLLEEREAVAVRFGTPKDADGDGLRDDLDGCPDEAEDRDGFADDDGCPEPDNDGDGVPDAADKCPLVAETPNGTDDADGCPDVGPDKDGDKIADDRDLCPEERETFNGVRDDDGCPEDPVVLEAGVVAVLPPPPPLPAPIGPADTDKDGIPDAFDPCPAAAEDKDGFQDWDGCPEPDDDGDGIPDEDDDCTLVAETFDGVDDFDGCPEPGADKDKDEVADAFDLCPEEAETYNGIRDDDGCPEDPAVLAAYAKGTAPLPEPPLRAAGRGDEDPDGDGVVGMADACPRAREDKDGFEDGDGCPDPDNDGDGVPDRRDECPLVAETLNSYLDDDGCPDEVKKSERSIVGIARGLTFKFASAKVTGKTKRVLKKVLGKMKKDKTLHLSIEGHTDNNGSRARNLKLSRRRARAVREWLVERGVDPERIEANGYGPDKPIESNDTKKGRAENRRVELSYTRPKEKR